MEQERAAMMRTREQRAALAVWHAIDACRTLAAVHPGVPILVRDWHGTVSSPSTGAAPGRPAVCLGVMSDGVAVVASLHNAPRSLGYEFVDYPTAEGLLDPQAVTGSAWICGLNEALVRMLKVARSSSPVDARAWP